VAAKRLADDTGLIGYVAFYQVFAGKPLQAIGCGEDIGRVGAAGGTPALAAVAQVECVEGAGDLVLNSPAEAGAEYRFAHDGFLTVGLRSGVL
jgi:hypothetical protein